MTVSNAQEFLQSMRETKDIQSLTAKNLQKIAYDEFNLNLSVAEIQAALDKSKDEPSEIDDADLKNVAGGAEMTTQAVGEEGGGGIGTYL